MEESKLNRLFGAKTDLCTIFLARPIFQSLNTFGKTNIKDIRLKHCESGFIKCLFSENEIDKGHLYVIYNSEHHFYTGKQKPVLNWEFFYDSVIKSKFYLEEIKINDNEYAFKIKFPEKWMKDYSKILNGQYSKVSKSYIETFYPTEDSFLYHLKNKTPEVCEFFAKRFNVSEKIFIGSEVGPKINFQSETLVIDYNISA